MGPGALELGAVQNSPGVGVECIPAVQNAAVVPKYQVMGLPCVMPGKLLLGGMGPEFIEQVITFLYGHPNDVCIGPPAEEKAFASRKRMSANDRMTRTGVILRALKVFGLFGA